MNSQTSLRQIFDLYNKLYGQLAGKSKASENFTLELYAKILDLATSEKLLLLLRSNVGAINQVTSLVNCNQTLKESLPYDEATLISKITHKLSISRTQNDASNFMKLYEQLLTSMEPRTRSAVLTFLLIISESNDGISHVKNAFSLQSDHLPAKSFHNNASNNQLNKLQLTAKSSSTTTSSSLSANDLFKITQYQGAISQTSLGPSSDGFAIEDRRKIDHVNQSSNTLFCKLTEDLVQEVIYSFTGIQGKYLKKDIVSGGFKLDPKAKTLNITNAGMLLRLGELGFYHNLVESFTDSKSGRSPLGLSGQGFVTALKNELTQYYGMVALLQDQLNRNRNNVNREKGDQVTLMKMMVWAAEPLHRLQWLATISDACQEKKGGALATAVAAFQNHGDPSVNALVRELLLAACGPLQYMLSKWLLEGEIDDPYAEFFIEILPEVGPDRLWSDKYRVRESMLPNFISKELANKVLVTGKSINFLREVCQDKTPIKGKEDLKQCFETNRDHLFSPVPDTKLHMLIDAVYLNTSKKVLDIVMGPHKLLKHLQAMRNYLLLGQGDFIGILIENLKPELDRPAKDLYSYELSSILDAAIRSTNAQYDDPEILTQLDVKLMNNFDGDLGWDIFFLKYTVRGPLATMLEPSMSKYQQLFKPLWRMKHLELVLSSKIWKDQMCNAKLLRSMQKELNPITYRLHLYSSEMIHFIHQMQYYILFEVIECLWTNMLDKVRSATALDDILDAHEEFLREVKIGAFLDDNDQIFVRLSNVFDAIIKLEVWQKKFYEICFKELDARKAMETQIKTNEAQGKYGYTAEDRLQRDEEQIVFEQALTSAQKLLVKIGSDYEISVRQFLLLLASSTDINLQLFGTRLDFNEYYKKRDQRLDEPYTFANIRQSSVYNCNKSGYGASSSTRYNTSSNN